MNRLVLLVALLGCHAPASVDEATRVGDNGQDYVPGAEWRTATPGQVGLDAARISAMVRDIASGRYGDIDGVAIVRFGYLAVEHYDGWPAAAPHTMQSVSKSITSLLYGIAAGTHADAALEQPVLDIFEHYTNVANVDDRKRALTVRHLLSMRTSMDFWEQPYAGSPLDQLNRSADDWVKFVLDRPMNGAPGSEWAYNSGAAIVVCGIVREVTHESVDAFARRTLFAPIGVTGEQWARSPYDGLPHCGGGLSLKVTDLARIGYLVLRHGRWGDQQVVARAWIDASTVAYSRGAPVFFSSFNAGYGYFWWLFPVVRGGTDTGVIAASGAGGQWLFVVPSLDLVVAVIANGGSGLDLLYDAVLPAVISR